MPHGQPAIFIVVFGSDPTGESAKTPRLVELGTWYHLLWLWVCALTERFVVIEISQVGCCLSKSASQGSRAKSYLRKKGRWEKGWRKPALSCDSSNAGDYREVPGELPRSWAHLKGSSSLYLSRGNSARPTEPLNSVGPPPAALRPSPADYSDMMSFFIEARLDFF